MKAILLIVSLASTLGFSETDPVKGSSADKKQEAVKNIPPQANAGEDLVISSKDIVQLDGTASREPDGIISRYHWTQIGGSPVVIANPQAAITALNVASKGEYSFRLSVIDDKGGLSTDEVKIIVK